MRYSRQSGFSLIELMVVIIIAGTLLAIAIPSYANYMERTRRTDARTALLEIAAAQERIFFERNQYTAAIADVWAFTDGGVAVSAEGHYALTVALNGGNRFTATATARGAQAGDEDCVTLTIDETGLRDATADVGGDKTVCW